MSTQQGLSDGASDRARGGNIVTDTVGADEGRNVRGTLAGSAELVGGVGYSVGACASGTL